MKQTLVPEDSEKGEKICVVTHQNDGNTDAKEIRIAVPTGREHSCAISRRCHDTYGLAVLESQVSLKDFTARVKIGRTKHSNMFGIILSYLLLSLTETDHSACGPEQALIVCSCRCMISGVTLRCMISGVSLQDRQHLSVHDHDGHGQILNESEHTQTNEAIA